MNEKRDLSSVDVPSPIAALLSTMSAIDSNPTRDFEAGRLPSWMPSEDPLPAEATGEWLFRIAGGSTFLADRSADIRALLTAYSQVLAEDRPELARLAKWQRVSPSALRHRYNELHVQAARELLNPDPLVDVILEAFPSLSERDLRGISPAIDRQLQIRKEMRSLVEDDISVIFGDDIPEQFGIRRNPVHPGATRLLTGFGSFLRKTLERRAPDLLETHDEWISRFESRAIKPEDVKPTGSRSRRPSGRT